MHALVRDLPDQIAARARALPDQIASLSGAARDLTASTAQISRREWGRAQRELDRARDFGKGLQLRFDRFAEPNGRPSRSTVAVSAFVLGAMVGGALLASPTVRNAVRQGWESLRRRRPAQAVGDGSMQSALQPAQTRQEDLIDEGLEESFPASDPLSVKHIT